MNVIITYDNTQHDGQTVISLDSEGKVGVVDTYPTVNKFTFIIQAEALMQWQPEQSIGLQANA